MVTTAPTQVAAPPAPARPRRRRAGIGPYLFLAPAIIYLAVFMGIPLVKGISLSTTDARLLRPNGGRDVGLENYGAVLQSGAFYRSLLATGIYTLGTVIAALLIGTSAAILINRSFRGRWLARAILTFPWAMPTVAAALIFSWIYNNQSGILNTTTRALGLGEHGWLIDPDFGMAAVLIATIWKVFPFVMLVVLGSLQSIPKELYEAGRIDGAGAWDLFRAVTLPHLMPTLRVVGLLMTIWSIRRFEIIYLLTGGGPADRTNTLVVNVYQTAFTDGRLGLAATIGVLGMVISTIVTIVYYAVERRQARGGKS